MTGARRLGPVSFDLTSVLQAELIPQQILKVPAECALAVLRAVITFQLRELEWQALRLDRKTYLQKARVVLDRVF